MATAAIVGSAALGAYSSRQASKAAQSGNKKARQSVEAAAQQARQDVLKFLPSAQNMMTEGARGAIETLRASSPAQQRQISLGNIAAQQTVGRGFEQAQQALLGQPVTPFESKGVYYGKNQFARSPQYLGNISKVQDQATQMQPATQPLDQQRIQALLSKFRGGGAL